MANLAHPVEFKVRRRMQGEVPSRITLDHGDLLVMDGLTQSEYAHRAVSGLQGPRVNLTFRWVTRHIASCPLAGATYCALPACVQGLAEPGPLQLGKGKVDGHAFGYWSSFCQSWCVSFLDALGLILEGNAVTVVGVHPARRCTPFRGARWVGGRRWRGVTVAQNAALHAFPLGFFGRSKPCSFLKNMGSLVCIFCWIYELGAHTWLG